MILDRNEDMIASGGRHPFLGKYKVRLKCRIFAATIKHFTLCRLALLTKA